MYATNLNSIYEEALRLYDRGFSIIPLNAGDKRPAIEWKAYQSHRPTVDQVKQWFGGDREHNLGIVTGAVSGVVVLDVDRPEALVEHVPRTPTVKTSKGWHYYFKHPGFDVGNCELPCGDLRGDGGQAVAPPSLHPNGVRYEWTVGPEEPLAELPDWVLSYTKRALPANDNGQTTAYGKAWFKDVEELAAVESGQRNNLLNKVACKAGSLIASGQLNEREARSAMEDACKRNGLTRDGFYGVLATINSGLKEGMRHPRYPTDPLETDTFVTDGKLSIRKASKIAPEKINWLWRDVLARGKLALLGGNPGAGKSQVSVSVAASISTGGNWPTSVERVQQADVVILNIEDDPADTTIPRLMAAGANLDRVHIVEGQVNLQQDITLLRDAIAEIGDVALVIVDPITAYLGKADMNNSGEVRAITNALTLLAHDYNLSVLLLHHLNKSADQDAAYRFQGSVAWLAAVRTAYVVKKEDTGRVIMAPAKSNVGSDQQAFAYSVQPVTLAASGIETSKVVWEASAFNTTAAQALAERNDGGKLAEAEEFLRTLLSDGPVEQTTIDEDAKQLGLSWATIRRAKKELGVTSYKEKGANGRWLWSLEGAQSPQSKVLNLQLDVVKDAHTPREGDF